MRTTLSAAALVVAAGLAAPAAAQTTPIKPPDHQTSTQEMNKAVPQMKPGQPGDQGAAGGQGAGTSGTAGAGAPGAGGTGPAVKPPEHERSATEDMTRAIPPMKPGEGAGTGAAPGTGQPGGWTADQKLRETGKEGAVEKPGPGAFVASGAIALKTFARNQRAGDAGRPLCCVAPVTRTWPYSPPGQLSR